MPVDALTAVRDGPLLPWWGIVLIGLVIGAVAIGAARPAVRARWPWVLPEVAAFGALALIHLLFFWQPYRTAAVVPRGGGDLASFFYPIHAFAAREVQDGRLPFWNPHLFAGAPHLANFQAGLLYPPNLLAYLLFDPFDYAALELLAILHFLLASWGAYWLARAYGIPRVGAVLTGALFAYSGFLVAHLGHYSMLATASWLPWVLAAVVATVRHDSWLLGLLGALPLTLAVLAGHQPILLFGLTGVVAVALFEVWRDGAGYPLGGGTGEGESVKATRFALRVPRPASPVPKLALTAILALGLSAPAVGPMLELTGYTVRSGLEYADASRFSVQPIALVHLVLPTVYGSNPTDYWSAFSNTEIWGYTGVLALALAAFGLVVQPTRTRVFWLLVGIVALLFLLGPFAALHGWAYAFLPGYDRVRGSGRAYLFFDLAVALLAGWGLAALLRERAGWSVRQAVVLKWGIVGLAGALAVVVGVLIPLLTIEVVSDPDGFNRPVIALDNAILLALWLVLGLGVVVAIWRGALQGGWLALAVITVVLLDLFRATAPFNPALDDVLAGYDHPEAIAFLRERYAEDGPFRVESIAENWQPNTALLVGLDEIGGLVDPLALADYDAHLARARQDRSSDAYRNLNARYLISGEQQEPPTGYREALRTSDGLVIWEAPDPRPRTWLVGSDVPVEVERPGPDRLILTLPADSPGGELVISQVAYPGWSATLDGDGIDLHEYDGVFQSLDVPSGAQTIELRFRPQQWTIWLAISVASAVAWSVTLALPLARGRQRSIVTP